MITSTLLGRPVWYELLTTDTAAAETFYKKVIGWTAAPFEGAPDPYTTFKRHGDVAVAGLMKTPAGMNMPTSSAASRSRSAATRWVSGTAMAHLTALRPAQAAPG